MNRFNLNSFFALDAILRASSLTEAARSIHLSQPATSLALRKLREFFRDDIVRYESGTAQLTPLAIQMQPLVAAVLEQSREIIALSERFDPALERRTVAICAPEVVFQLLLPPLLAKLAIDAPGIKIEAVSTQANRTGRAHCDIVILPEWAIDNDRQSWPVLNARFACLTHSDFGLTMLDEDTFLQQQHVTVDPQIDTQFWPENSSARHLLNARKIGAQAGSTSAFPYLIRDHHFVATTATWFAQSQASMSPFLSCVTAPLSLPPVQFAAQPARHANDLIYRFIISSIKDVLIVYN